MIGAVLSGLMVVLARRRRTEGGVSTLEYGFIVAGIAAVIILPTQIMQLSTDATFRQTCAQIEVDNGTAPAQAWEDCKN